MGAGSGLISIYAAKQGAIVTASDINPIAIEFLSKNRLLNKADFQIIHSDLFKTIPKGIFDIIAINPPYYKKDPHSQAEYAWCCGANGEYFSSLFSGLADYVGSDSVVLMTLCDGCDVHWIANKALQHGFSLHCIFKRINLLETNFIFTIKSIHAQCLN